MQLATTAAAHVVVVVLWRRLWTPCQATGSIASTALAVLEVLEALALCCGFGGFGSFGSFNGVGGFGGFGGSRVVTKLSAS